MLNKIFRINGIKVMNSAMREIIWTRILLVVKEYINVRNRINLIRPIMIIWTILLFAINI